MKLLETIISQRGLDPNLLKEEREAKLDWPELYEVSFKVMQRVIFKKDYTNIGILYDPDVDGLYSGYILENFLYRAGVPKEKLHRFMNLNKLHGASKEMVEWVRENDIDELFIVDAGSSNVPFLTEHLPDIQVTILDHHPYEKSDVVNENIELINVSDHEHLPDLSGCGVVYRFIESIGNKINVKVEDYELFVGMTVLSDVCDMLTPENRYYVRQAYNNYHANGFLQQFKFWGSTKTFFSFQVIPYLNALIRLGRVDWAMTVVNNMDEYRVYKEVEVDSIRSKQKQKEIVEDIRALGQLKKTDGCVIHIRHEGKDLKSFNGLLGNKLMSEHDSSALVITLDKDNRVWGGSFRGKHFSNDVLQEYGFECMGHDKACGVLVPHESLVKFIENFELKPEMIDIPTRDIADWQLCINDIDANEYVEIAKFNEMAGANLDTIKLELLHHSREYQVIPGNNRDIYKLEGVEIVDFMQESFVDNMIVEPSTSRKGYQLIRIK